MYVDTYAIHAQPFWVSLLLGSYPTKPAFASDAGQLCTA